MPIRARSASPTLTGSGLSSVRSLKVPRSSRLAALPSHEQYARALHRHLAGMPPREIDFFINPRRMQLIERLIGPALRLPSTRVLNVACGPFAVEYYMKLATCRVTSFDREAKLAPLHHELTSRGLIAPTDFHVADAASFHSDETFDIVLINDLFYSRHIDFYDLIEKYAALVRSGGLLYFDIQDERAGPIWRLFGKDKEFRRYDLADVERVVRGHGFKIEAVEPALGIKGGLDGLVRRAMWAVARLANSHVIVARKNGP